MTDEILIRRDNVVVRRQRLEPGEDTGWHRDPYHRVSIVLHGQELSIQLPDGTETARIPIRPGQVDWDEPYDLPHRGVNVGDVPYEEIAVFFTGDPDADPQPRASI